MKNLLLFFVLLCFISCSTPHYCYIVRHAEKEDNTPNSLLSPAGRQRAEILKDSLLHKGIDAIFASPFIRTQETANPLALAIHKPVAIYRQNAIDSIVAVIKSSNNRNILLVGHSGPLPAIIEGLTGQKIKQLGENEYDNFYIIKTKKGKTELIIKKYGNSSK